MSGPLYLGIDSGTQGVKVAVLDPESGRTAAQAQAPHPLIEDDSGRREQEPRWWTEALEKALDQVLAEPGVDPGAVRAMGVSGQQHGFVPLDTRDQVIRPAKLWCDTETADQAEELTQRLGGEQRAIELTGNSIAVGYTASKITWLREREPANYDRLAAILLPHDYLNFWLTGEKTAEYGDASGTAFFDVRTRTWSGPVLRAMDPSGRLESCLPRLIQSHQPAGRIRPELARRFGLSPKVLVSAGGGDNMMAAIGTGNVVPGVVTASLGTSGTIFATAASPVVDPAGELAAFCGSSGLWLPLVCTMNVTVSTELTRSLLDMDIQAFSRLAGSARPGSGGLILVPFFNGERTPALPRATASLSGLSAVNFTPANLCRAALEGPTLGLRYGLEVMRRQGVEPEEIRLIGGGAKNPLWRRIVAGVLGLPVVCPISTEAGALGAAIQALHCDLADQGQKVEMKELTDRLVHLDPSTRIEPDPAEQDLYQRIYRRYLRTVEALGPLYEGP